MKLSPVPVNVFHELTYYQCDSCGNGNMYQKTDGSVSLTFPPKYQHICESCGYESYLVGVFPSITIKYQLEDGTDVSSLVDI